MRIQSGWLYVVVLVLATTLGCGGADVPALGKVDGAIQAIEQAPDPSAVVAAYANGFALDPNDPKLYAAYVSRMIDLGLPEMAYHQAQTLTTLQASNGLAWGVIAYVDARRGQMPEAVSAINLAGQFASDNKFVQHTAGELVAWYDFKADKSQIPDSATAGLAKVRELLDTRPDFTEAYAAARKAYETQPASMPSPNQAPAPSQVTPASSQVEPVAPTWAGTNATQVAVSPMPPAVDQLAPLGYTPPDYYGYDYPYYYSYYPNYPAYSGIYLNWGPSYCYDWGPGWVAPLPWCWWQPCGFWSGCSFSPFAVSCVFGHSGDFHHYHNGYYGHDGHFGYGNDYSGHGHGFAGNRNPEFWHRGPQGHNDFFGTPTRPSPSVALWARSGRARSVPSARVVAGTSQHWWNNPRQPALLANPGGYHSMEPSRSVNRVAGFNPVMTTGHASGFSRNWNAAASGSATSSAQTHSRGSWTQSQNLNAQRTVATSPLWGGQTASRSGYSRGVTPIPAPADNHSEPSHRFTFYSAPRYASPGRSFSQGHSGWPRSVPLSSGVRSYSGAAGGFGQSHAFGGFRAGGGSYGGFHGGGFAAGGGFRGGIGGSGFHGAGRR